MYSSKHNEETELRVAQVTVLTASLSAALQVFQEQQNMQAVHEPMVCPAYLSQRGPALALCICFLDPGRHS